MGWRRYVPGHQEHRTADDDNKDEKDENARQNLHEAPFRQGIIVTRLGDHARLRKRLRVSEPGLPRSRMLANPGARMRENIVSLQTNMLYIGRDMRPMRAAYRLV